MSDRRFLVALVSALIAALGICVIVFAALGLQNPTYRDFDTGAVRDTSRTLFGLVVLGTVLLLGGLGTCITLTRRQMRHRR